MTKAFYLTMGFIVVLSVYGGVITKLFLEQKHYQSEISVSDGTGGTIILPPSDEGFCPEDFFLDDTQRVYRRIGDRFYIAQ